MVKNLPAIFIVLFLLQSCSSLPAGNAYGVKPDDGQLCVNIDVQMAYDLVQTNKSNSRFMIIDVRTMNEFTNGHIEQAANLDYNSMGFTININRYDRKNNYLIYCRSGNRSNQALSVMKNLGFRRVYNLFGGINEWKNKGFPVVLY